MSPDRIEDATAAGLELGNAGQISLDDAFGALQRSLGGIL